MQVMKYEIIVLCLVNIALFDACREWCFMERVRLFKAKSYYETRYVR